MSSALHAGLDAEPSRITPSPWGELLAAACCLLGGVLVGLAWAAARPMIIAISDSHEEVVGADISLGIAGIIAAMITTALLAVFAGRRPLFRAVVVLISVVFGAFISWGVGRMAGAPALHAVGFILIWPACTALLTALRMLVGMAIWPDGPRARH